MIKYDATRKSLLKIFECSVSDAQVQNAVNLFNQYVKIREAQQEKNKKVVEII